VKKTFFLVDTDPSFRQVLASIIESEELGRVVGAASDGESSENTILDLAPEIVLIDMLLTDQNGVQTVQHLRGRNYKGKIIMLSKVDEQTMITEAYESGIEFYVRKPLNKVEIISIIKSTLEKLQLQATISAIRSAVEGVDSGLGVMEASGKPKHLDPERARKVLLRILTDLGILGEAGCRDINSIILYLLGSSDPGEGLIQLHHLQSVYKAVREHYERTQERGPSFDEKAIEQRVRRAVGAALHNVASLGVEDYGHQLFNTYANKLFDFSEVRNEMRFLRGESPYHGKINVKKFLEALLIEVQQQARE